MVKLIASAVVALVMFGSIGTGVAFADHGDDGHTPWADAGSIDEPTAPPPLHAL